jgi:RNA polymerase-binding transcription factor DksA
MTEQRPRLDVDRFRRRLNEMRAQVEEDLDTYRRRVVELEGGPDEPGQGAHWERSGYGDHQGDAATEVFEKEKSLGMEQTLTEHLRQITHALSRLEAGSYGVCENCGQPIAPDRLEAMPEATLCVRCKAAQERQEAPERRVTPGVTS